MERCVNIERIKQCEQMKTNTKAATNRHTLICCHTGAYIVKVADVCSSRCRDRIVVRSLKERISCMHGEHLFRAAKNKASRRFRHHHRRAANEVSELTSYLVVGLPANAKHRRTWKSGTYEMF